MPKPTRVACRSARWTTVPLARRGTLCRIERGEDGVRDHSGIRLTPGLDVDLGQVCGVCFGGGSEMEGWVLRHFGCVEHGRPPPPTPLPQGEGEKKERRCAR